MATVSESNGVMVRVQREPLPALLSVQPNEMRIAFILHEEVSYPLVLRNVSGGCVAYKVKTTAPKRYMVRPTQGTIEYGASETLAIVLAKMNEYPDSGNPRNLRDKFMVQCAPFEGHLANDHDALTLFWKQAEQLHAPRKDAYTYFDEKLKCKLVLPLSSANEAIRSKHSADGIQGAGSVGEPIQAKIETTPTESTHETVSGICESATNSLMNETTTDTSTSLGRSQVDAILPDSRDTMPSGTVVSTAQDTNPVESISKSNSLKSKLDLNQDGVPTLTQNRKYSNTMKTGLSSRGTPSTEERVERDGNSGKGIVGLPEFDDRTPRVKYSTAKANLFGDARFNKSDEYERMLAYTVKLSSDQILLKQELQQTRANSAALSLQVEALRQRLAEAEIPFDDSLILQSSNRFDIGTLGRDGGGGSTSDSSTERWNKFNSSISKKRSSNSNQPPDTAMNASVSEMTNSTFKAEQPIVAGVQLWQLLVIALISFVLGRIF